MSIGLFRNIWRTLAIFLIAPAVALTMAGTAQAATGTWSSGGKSGVHAQGSWKTENSKLYISGYLRDTACDGKNVKIELVFIDVQPFPFGRPYRYETVVNSTGCGTNKNFSYNTYRPTQKTRISIKECIINGGRLPGVDSCGPLYTVVEATP